MKNLLFLFWVMAVQTASASGIFELNLGKDEKLEGTYAADIGGNRSVHFAIVRHSSEKRYFELIPFVVNADKQVKRLQSAESSENFNILSHHVKGDVLTVVNFGEKGKQLVATDFNLSTGQNFSASIDAKKAPDNIFRLKDQSVLVYFDKGDGLAQISMIGSASDWQRTTIQVAKDQIKSFKSFISETPEAVNQQEFVRNGSISDRKGYWIDGRLVYTLQNGKESLEVMTLDPLHPDEVKIVNFPSGFGKEVGEVSNYVFGDKLIFLGIDKQDAGIRAFSLSGKGLLKSLSLKEDFKQTVASSTLEGFVQTALKSRNKATITLNRTIEQKLLLRMDNVRKDEYVYYYNWHWHFMWMHQMMWQNQMMQMHQQQMMMSRPGGPSVLVDVYGLGEREVLNSVELLLEPDFTPADFASKQTEYPNLDREKYLDKYQEDKTVKQMSSAFTDDELRIVYWNPKSRSVVISSEKL